MLNCPACSHLLEQQHHGQIMIQICSTGCGGMWIRQSDLETLTLTPRLVERIHQSSSGILVIQEPRARICPDCQIPLEAWLVHGSESVEIDTCPQCSGIWLDQGELQRIVLLQSQGAFKKTRQTAHKVHSDERYHLGDALVDTAYFAPDLPIVAVDAAIDLSSGLTQVATEALPASVELVSSSAEVIASSASAVIDTTGGAVEAIGGIGDIFGGIAEIFGGLFS